MSAKQLTDDAVIEACLSQAMKRAFHSDAAEWVPKLADACLALGTSAFHDAVLAVANAIAPVDGCTILILDNGIPSACEVFVGEADPRPMSRIMTKYLAGGFRFDPHLRHLLGTGPGLIPFRLEDIPRAYRRDYIDSIDVSDAVPWFIKKQGRVAICIPYLVRQLHNSNYTQHERTALARVLPVLTRLSIIHGTLSGWSLRPLPTNRAAPEDEIQLLGERLGSSPFDGLTERERQVCFLVLLGYSSEAIGLRLGIAKYTVWTYRKRSYEKLGVVSQNELFSLYLRSLPGFARAPQPEECGGVDLWDH